MSDPRRDILLVDDDPGLLRIEFPDRGDDEDLERIQWDEFFEK